MRTCKKPMVRQKEQAKIKYGRTGIQGSHLLCPSLQMAHNLCSLLELLDTLHGMLITEGEVGQRTVDSHYMSNYLKVISEIAQGR